MRNLCILTLTVLLAACQEPAAVTNLDVTITDSEEDAQLIIKGAEYVKEIDLVEGATQDTLMITQEGQYTFRLGWQTLTTYLKPGASVSIKAEAEEFGAKGTFANEEQQEVAAYFQGKEVLLQEFLEMRKLGKMEVDSFLNALKIGQEKLLTHLDKASIPAAMTAAEREGIGYKIKIKEILYPNYSGKDKADLPEALQNPLVSVNMHDEETYQSNLDYSALIDLSFRLAMNADTSSDYIGAFMRRIEARPDGPIRNALLFNNLRYMIGPNEDLEEQMAFFKKYSSNDKDLAIMEEQYSAFQKLMPGNPSPSFDYENYVGGNTKLEDLRGKYVYVDVWATWCGPCIREIPSLKEKEEQYHNANVEFVSLSIDDPEDEEKWRGMIKDRDLGGTQLIADNAWESQFPKDYQINGIPRFILIDPKGHIVSADAPRPSSEDFDELFAAEGMK
ncbi:MAG: TlpA disulfide reductase family protein [Bacteroidota bacterium]